MFAHKNMIGLILAAILICASMAFAQDSPFDAAPMAPAEEAPAAPVSPFGDAPAAPADTAPAPASPFSGAPAAPADSAPAPASPFDNAPIAPSDTSAAPASPFGDAPAMPADTAPAAPADAASASPFDDASADTADAAPANPFGDDTSASPFDDATDVNPFGNDTTGEESADAISNVFEPTTYWYDVELPDEETPREDGDPVRLELPYSEYKQKYDQRVQAITQIIYDTNEGDWQNQGWDPMAMAQWKVYYEQVEAWQMYVEDIVLDEELPDWVGDIDFTTMDQGGIETAMTGLSDDAREVADTITDDLHRKLVKFVEGLDTRKNRRINYYDWRLDQREQFLEIAERWVKRSRGSEIDIDGNIYLISDKPIQSAPRNVLPVVTNNLTPYDIFNDDGTLKRAN